jgi:hypothetical protein
LLQLLLLLLLLLQAAGLQWTCCLPYCCPVNTDHCLLVGACWLLRLAACGVAGDVLLPAWNRNGCGW